MNVTFHRAFDMVNDQDEALEAIVYAGCDRILTSGGQQTAPKGIDTLAKLVLKAGNRVSIMPGSGINLSNIKLISEVTQVKEIHLSARKSVPGKMKFRQPLVTMGGQVSIPDYDLQLPDEQAITEIIKLFA
jgi:copper homeostasis protein